MRQERAILGATAIVASALVGAAQAPAPNPVLGHYRDHRAAMERDDLAAAETAAEAARGASEARDGDGGRTAVRAINLAHVRLDRGRGAQALAPARRAHDLAAARGAESGVDPLVARLALGRAELAVDGTAGEARLLAALNDAQTRTDIHADAHAATRALISWAFANRKWRTAQTAAIAASRHAAGAPFSEAFGRADARMGEGVAVLFQRRDREAYTAFTEAVAMFRPLADVLSPGGEMTIAQSHLARAMAWRSLVVARLRSMDRTVPGVPEGGGYVEGEPTPLSPPCPMRIVATPRPNYPREALEETSVGAVVLRLRIANGEIVDRKVAAAVPMVNGFAESVAAVMDRWRIEREDDAPANCRMDMTVYQTVMFAFQ
jgi:hypothetical protein